ncbi:MAG: TatD family hydrolase [Saprospiraceae bacterium]|nr:TatD family hydrolase [Saprospiraceae bacterium]
MSGIFHCFNGTSEQAQKIIDLGFYLGIGGVITYKNAGVDKIIADLPLSSMVLETDAPYLTPVPHRGKRNECAYIKIIAQKTGRNKMCPIGRNSIRRHLMQKIFLGHTKYEKKLILNYELNPEIFYLKVLMM